MKVRVGDSMAEGVRPTDSIPRSVREVLYRISQGTAFQPGQLGHTLLDLMGSAGSVKRDALLVAMLTGVMARGPTEDEVVEVLEAALSLDDCASINLRPPSGKRLILLAGSGKKGIKSFNISTSSALIAAAVGASIVKIGSRATSSVMGSRDLADCLGLPKNRTEEEITTSVERHGLAFVPIEERIPVLDGVYGGRFHVLNPLSFGLAALAARLHGSVLVFGLAHPKVDLAARVLRRFGVADALIVASGDERGYFADEVGLGRRSFICAVKGSEITPTRTLTSHELDFGDVGPFQICEPASADEALRWVLDALAGDGNPGHLHLVALNAAVLLVEAGLARDLADGHGQALEAIRDGRAWRKLEDMSKDVLFTTV